MNAVEASFARDYLEGGAGTVPADNEQQWQRFAIYPRPLAGISSVDVSTDVVGQRIDLPVLAAASAAHGLWHPKGEVETARGVREAGSILALSQVSTRAPAEVTPHSGPYLQQLYLPQERDFALPFISEVTGLGAIGLIPDSRPDSRAVRAALPSRRSGRRRCAALAGVPTGHPARVVVHRCRHHLCRSIRSCSTPPSATTSPSVYPVPARPRSSR